jgi:type IV pilus assembly protein PilX
MTHANLPRAQQGIALIVVLILLLVMSLLAIVSLRGTMMEERMSANMADRSLSFQAAEAALRQGEQLAALHPALPANGCAAGVCAMPAPSDAPRWTKDSAAWAGARSVDINLGTHTATSKYIVELIATGVPSVEQCLDVNDINARCAGLESRYRITAMSTAAGRSTVMLQTNYAVP